MAAVKKRNARPQYAKGALQINKGAAAAIAREHKNLAA